MKRPFFKLNWLPAESRFETRTDTWFGNQVRLFWFWHWKLIVWFEKMGA